MRFIREANEENERSRKRTASDVRGLQVWEVTYSADRMWTTHDIDMRPLFLLGDLKKFDGQ
eukprot:4913458-Alexandrium_andersonii.AAC.1